MRGLPYLPYDKSAAVPNVVIDGSPNAGTRLTLSHWPGAPTPGDLRDDLSAQIAFHALARPELFDGIEAVTNNHFDQDGLAGVFALWRPDLALPRRDLLIDVARAGDFGTFHSRDAARIAFAVLTFHEYEPALEHFVDLLDHPHKYRERWGVEDEALSASLLAIENGRVAVNEYPKLDLVVFVTPIELHSMALYRSSGCLRVATVTGRRYRLECRYESWVMLMSRVVAPRPDLRVLAAELDALEPDGARWEADPPGSLFPSLRLADGNESGLSPEKWVAVVRSFLVTAPAAWDPFAPR
jgi:hypothetical protein